MLSAESQALAVSWPLRPLLSPSDAIGVRQKMFVVPAAQLGAIAQEFILQYLTVDEFNEWWAQR